MKQLFLTIIRFLLAIFMIYAGMQHFIKPDFYLPFVPSFLPFQMVIIYASGVLEMILGITLLLNKKYAKYAALGVLLLMILFLPIHIRDVFCTNPAIGSHNAALVRLPIQFVFIALSWLIYRVLSKRVK